LNRCQQRFRRRRNLCNGAMKRIVIGLRRLVVTADFAHELQRGGLDFFIGDRWRGPAKDFNTAAHSFRIAE